MNKKDNKKKIPQIREEKKWVDYDTVMNSKEATFEDLIGLINLYPKKTRHIVEKVLSNSPTAEQFVRMYNKVKNTELKDKIFKSFHAHVKKQSEDHHGNDEDMCFLIDSVLIENRNPFYIKVNVKDFLDMLLSWQRVPMSFHALTYLFDVVFSGSALNLYKRVSEQVELHNKYAIFTDSNIKEIFKVAYFGVEFPGKTKEGKEILRKHYLVEILGKLIDCIKETPLQIGDTKCCDELSEKLLDNISLVRKYAKRLCIINAISKDVKAQTNALMDCKEKAVLTNQKKWKKSSKTTTSWAS